MVKSHHTFNFGKHRGLTVQEVASVSPGYIYFCENELGMRFTPKVKRTCLLTSARKRGDFEDSYLHGSFAEVRRRNRPMFY